jgi:hypothetical protein
VIRTNEKTPHQMIETILFARFFSSYAIGLRTEILRFVPVRAEECLFANLGRAVDPSTRHAQRVLATIRLRQVTGQGQLRSALLRVSSAHVTMALT